MAARLSNRLVVNTNPPRGERVELRDTLVKGLICDCTARTKTFRLRYQSQGKRQMVALGTYPAISVEQARTKALQLIEEAKNVRTDRIRVGELSKQFVEMYSKPNKASWKADEADLEKHVVQFFGEDAYAEDVDRRQVADFTLHLAKEYPGRPRANRIYAVARKMFRWAASVDRIPTDPTVGVGQPVKKKPPRHRILTDVEIKQLWTAVEDKEVHDSTRYAIRMLLLTGLRPTEVFRMEWAWVKKDQISIPPTGTKTKQAQHIVPLTKQLSDLIKQIPKTSKYMFPSKGNPSKQIDATSCGQLVRRKIDADYILHDIRRTVASWLVSNGVGMDTARSILGHKPQGVLGEVYLHETAQIPHVKKALTLWHKHVLSLVK